MGVSVDETVTLFDGWRWKTPESWLKIQTIDTHTGGEPLRIVTGGLPSIEGSTVLEKRRYFMQNYDHLRRGLLREPRGHADQYGAVISKAQDEADLDVFFLNTEGYSPMCGHAILAITKVVFECGLITAQDDHPELIINVPAGRNYVRATMKQGAVVSCAFDNVASFVYLKDQKVVVPDLGEIKFDIAFGGAFYAVVDATALDLVLTGDDFNKHVDYGRKIKQAVLDNFEIRHPVEEELSSLFGVIFTGAAFDDRHHSRNVTVFEDGEVDRSPTGSGISARVALLYERGELAIGETITIESILGSTMTVAVAREEAFEGYSAIIPTVSGSAYIMGVNEILFDPKDPFNEGFIFR